VLWLRGLIFTALVPFVVGYLVPQNLRGPVGVAAGAWQLGYVLFAVGAALYLWCLVCFLLAGGTPAIFFTRHFNVLIGKEPLDVVRNGPYRFSRNPMYVGVVTAIFGQALLYRSRPVFVYGVCVAFTFHLVVVLLEEPHLRRVRGDSYAAYLNNVPRWLGWPHNSGRYFDGKNSTSTGA
jgi:protein-S-isoprenylcysteine O-methyltransferase Ste14